MNGGIVIQAIRRCSFMKIKIYWPECNKEGVNDKIDSFWVECTLDEEK